MIRCWFWVFLILLILYLPNFDFDHKPISEVLQITTVNTFLMAEHILLQTYAELLFASWKCQNPGHTIALHRASWVLSAIVRKKMFFSDQCHPVRLILGSLFFRFLVWNAARQVWYCKNASGIILYYVSKKTGWVGGFRKWQFLLMFRTVFIDLFVGSAKALEYKVGPNASS